MRQSCAVIGLGAIVLEQSVHFFFRGLDGILLSECHFQQVGSAELDFRVLRRWRLAIFYDAGNAFDGKPHKLEQATGLGVRWLSPIGFIRLDGALAVSRSGPPFRLHIIIGPDL